MRKRQVLVVKLASLRNRKCPEGLIRCTRDPRKRRDRDKDMCDGG